MSDETQHPVAGPILISTSTYPLGANDGLPRFVADLATALAHETEVIVLAPGAPGYPATASDGDVEVLRFSYFWPPTLQKLAYGGGMPQNLRASLMAKLQVPFFLWRQMRALKRIVRKRGVRHVNSHWLVPQGLTTAWVRGKKGRFFHLLQVHAADVYLLQRIPLGRALARFVVSRCDAIFADGSHVSGALDELLGCPSGAALRPMGVDRKLFRRNGGHTSEPSPFPEGFICFVGRFVEKKGVEYLLTALPRVRETHPGIGLVLVGYGPLESALRREVSRLGLDEVVHFTGRLPHREIVPYLHQSRVVAVPSIIDSHGETEGMPTVVLEALAAGCRVVGTTVDGIPDLLAHRVNGWLCREKDPEDLAEKLLESLQSTGDAEVIERALDTAHRNDWAAVSSHYLEVLTRADG